MHGSHRPTRTRASFSLLCFCAKRVMRTPAVRKLKVLRRSHFRDTSKMGRPRKHDPGVAHVRRAEHVARYPLHVTLRVERHVWNLRARRSFKVIEKAFWCAMARSSARICHFSVLGNHIHMIVEAADRATLSAAMRSLGVRLGKGMNGVMRSHGRVVADRYLLRELRSPSQVARARRYGRSFGLVFADLDGFKQLNDRYGHPVGDETLVAFANVLAESLRKPDDAFRIGGDEFAVILAEASDDDARRVVERVRTLLDGLAAEGKPWLADLHASFGCASCPEDADDPQTLFRLADEAQYDAKRNGTVLRFVARGA